MWKNTGSESQENYILPLLKGIKEIKEQKKDERKDEMNDEMKEGKKEGRTD